MNWFGIKQLDTIQLSNSITMPNKNVHQYTLTRISPLTKKVISYACRFLIGIFPFFEFIEFVVPPNSWIYFIDDVYYVIWESDITVLFFCLFRMKRKQRSLSINQLIDKLLYAYNSMDLIVFDIFFSKTQSFPFTRNIQQLFPKVAIVRWEKSKFDQLNSLIHLLDCELKLLRWI